MKRKTKPASISVTGQQKTDDDYRAYAAIVREVCAEINTLIEALLSQQDKSLLDYRTALVIERLGRYGRSASMVTPSQLEQLQEFLLDEWRKKQNKRKKR
jgi:hypothetical protein